MRDSQAPESTKRCADSRCNRPRAGIDRGALAKRPRAAPAAVVRAFLSRLGLSRADRALHRHIDRSAIDEQVLADDESGIAAAEKCTRLAEFFGRAETACGIFGHARGEKRFVILSRFCREFVQAVYLAIGQEWARQQIIDRNVMLGVLSR